MQVSYIFCIIMPNALFFLCFHLKSISQRTLHILDTTIIINIFIHTQYMCVSTPSIVFFYRHTLELYPLDDDSKSASVLF